LLLLLLLHGDAVLGAQMLLQESRMQVAGLQRLRALSCNGSLC
jgi:hypothetical protein